MCAYKANKPQGTDKFKVSPNDINGNFTDLKAAFDTNHVALTGTANGEGKHFKIDLTRQAVAPVPANDDITLYNAFGATLTTIPQLWWIRNSVPGPGTTATPITEGLTATYPNPGWFRHGSGLLIKFGKATAPHAGPNYTLDFPVAANIPAFVTVPVVIATAVTNGATASLILRTGTTTTTFNVRTTAPSIGGNVEVNFIAIGT